MQSNDTSARHLAVLRHFAELEESDDLEFHTTLFRTMSTTLYWINTRHIVCTHEAGRAPAYFFTPETLRGGKKKKNRATIVNRTTGQYAQELTTHDFSNFELKSATGDTGLCARRLAIKIDRNRIVCSLVLAHSVRFNNFTLFFFFFSPASVGIRV